jgi:hypothetical protein
MEEIHRYAGMPRVGRLDERVAAGACVRSMALA